MFDSIVCKKKDGTPLKSYESEFEAEEAIEYVKLRYGNEQVKYRCPQCGYWHLAPPIGVKMFDSAICKKKDGTPLKAYESKIEADKAIKYVKDKYGNKQVSYKCSKCGCWHLSPMERQTPNHRSNCLDSQGKIKQAYPTKESAETRAQIISKEQGIRIFVYKCDQCGEYHLTHIKY